jgi:two-component system response regulator YesN
MYRLLIVDDEEIIVDGLYEIFKSLKYLDLDVYKSYSGREAIEWLNRTRIDIVLTDIKMPEIDGLQLLEEIYVSWPQCRVIFLTGYNEFDYVYKAIQHNGVSYILKTEDHEKIISAVENAIAEIQKGIRIEGLILKAKEQMNIALEMFRNDYLIHLLHEELSVSTTLSQFEQLEVPIRSELPVILGIGHVDNIPADMGYRDKIQYLYSVGLIISQNLNTKITSVNVMDEKYRFVLFMQPNELLVENPDDAKISSCYEKAVSFLKGTLEVIQTACRESLDASISFVIGGEPCRWEDVSKKYYSLKQMLNYKIGTGIEMLLIDNEFNVLTASPANETVELETDTECLEALLRKTNMDLIGQYLEMGQRDKFFEILSELLNPMKSIKSRNSNLAIEAYYKVALTLQSYINRCKLTGKIAFYIGQNKLMRIEQHESWVDAIQYLFDISDIIFRLQSEEQKKRADNAIDYIQKYVEDHLSEDLSLVRLAEKVYLNPSYLSRLYKQTTGATLSDFIDNARIKKAKELLKKENVKIHEVSKAVGYETAASFTRFFRKIIGCSPQEYHDTSMIGK